MGMRCDEWCSDGSAHHLTQLRDPVAHPPEAVYVRDVKHQQRGVGVAVVDGACAAAFRILSGNFA